MHKLGNDSMTANDQRTEIKAVLTARRNLYNAGVALLECNNVYASNIKFALERLTFSSHTVSFVGAGAVKKQIDETYNALLAIFSPHPLQARKKRGII